MLNQTSSPCTLTNESPWLIPSIKTSRLTDMQRLALVLKQGMYQTVMKKILQICQQKNKKKQKKTAKYAITTEQ